MSVRLTLLLLILATGSAWAEFVVEPASLPPGGVAMVRWVGEPLPERVVITFHGQTQPVYQQGNEIHTLLGVDLDAQSGSYPIEIAWFDQAGARSAAVLPLEVQRVERPAERLTLPQQMVSPTEKQILKRIAQDRKLVSRIYALRTPALSWGRFSLPVTGEVRSTFGLRRILNGEEKSAHSGVDFRAPAGAPVSASGGGRVALAEELYYTGKTVIIDHGGGLFTLYAHLQSFAVQAGDPVGVGDLIGAVGSTGRSTGPHLHFGTRIGTARVDPLALLQHFSGESH